MVLDKYCNEQICNICVEKEVQDRDRAVFTGVHT